MHHQNDLTHARLMDGSIHLRLNNLEGMSKPTHAQGIPKMLDLSVISKAPLTHALSV